MPKDKEDKNTADGFTPSVSSTGAEGKGDNAARVLDFPISTSHSPQTDNLAGANADKAIVDDKKSDHDEYEQDENIKRSIGDQFYKDESLGLSNSEEERARHQLAVHVLRFMW